MAINRNCDTVADKAAEMKSLADQTIGSFVDEGKHLMAFQVARAFADVPEDSLARFYDILNRVV